MNRVPLIVVLGIAIGLALAIAAGSGHSGVDCKQYLKAGDEKLSTVFDPWPVTASIFRSDYATANYLRYQICRQYGE